MRLTLNLASRRYVNESAIKWGYLLFSVLLLLLITFQVWLCLQSRQLNHSYQVEIDQLAQQLGNKVPERFTGAQIAAQKQDFSRAEELLQKDAFRWTALFDRMERLLSSGVSIRSFSPNYKDGSLVLNGVAKKLSDLQDLLNNLHADNFDQVFLQSQRQFDVDDFDGTKIPAIDFSLRLEGVFK